MKHVSSLYLLLTVNLVAMDGDRRYWGVPLEPLFDEALIKPFPESRSLSPILADPTVGMTTTQDPLGADAAVVRHVIIENEVVGNQLNAPPKPPYAATNKSQSWRPKGKSHRHYMHEQLVEWGIGHITTASGGAQSFIYEEIEDELREIGLTGMERFRRKAQLVEALYQRELSKRAAEGESISEAYTSAVPASHT